jgi:acetolactate synthase I/II/III large subunit
MVTALADAYMDSIPMVCITGQVGAGLIGTDAFQEADIVGITRSVTKHNELVMKAEDIPRAVAEAFHIATTGRPGPVLLDIPKSIVDPMNPDSQMDWYWPETLDLPGYKVQMEGDTASIKAAAEMITAAKRPILYVGGGVLKARGSEALQQLAEMTGIHAVTTLMARGSLPDSHPLCLGMPGMHGNYTAITSMQESDLLITLGARFDDRVTGKLSGFAPNAKIIHVDIDPAEMNKIRKADVPIVGDVRVVTEQLIQALQGKQQPNRDEWTAQLHQWQEQYPLHYNEPEEGEPLKPQAVIEAIRNSVDDSTILASGVGQHQMWASQHWRFEQPYTWINSGGLGTMGFSVPAAIGAKVGRPDRTVWAVDGDGCFQMTAQELVTAALERIPVKIAILNNSYLGMVRQWQEMFYDERYSEVYLSPDLPDFVGWSESMGCVGMRVEHPDGIQAAIDKANEIDDRPVVIDFRTDAREKVYPMVAAGKTNSEVTLSPEQGEGGR